MAYRSTYKFARCSARKARLVVDLVRGKRYEDAIDELRFSKRRASVMVLKALESAFANADQAEADTRNLYVSEARVDEGPTMKRFQPKDRGRAHPILKRTCHIHLSLDEISEDVEIEAEAEAEQAA
jgi:large subunit ribosomal protein L22